MTPPRLPRGEAGDPDVAGWRYLSFAVHSSPRRCMIGAHGIETADHRCWRVVRFRVGELELPGRASVWDGLPSAVYLPPGVVASLAPAGPSRDGRGRRCAGVGSRRPPTAPVRIGPEDVTRRGPRRRQRDAPDQPHHHARLSGRPPRGRRGATRRRATGARGRRTSTTPTTCRARRSSRRSTTTDSGDRRRGACSGCTAARLEGAVGGARRRDGDRPRRLPPVRRHARRRRLLPQRAGRRRPHDGLLVRPGPVVGHAMPGPEWIPTRGCRSSSEDDLDARRAVATGPCRPIGTVVHRRTSPERRVVLSA